MRLIVSIAVLALSTLPALADRQVTEDERANLVAAAQAEGCSGGKFEFDDDDQQFGVDDAGCERQRLEQLGVAVGPLEHVPEAVNYFDFRDPDGNVLSFYSEIT